MALKYLKSIFNALDPTTVRGYSIASRPETKNLFGRLKSDASVNVAINFEKGNITIDFNGLTNDEKDERKELIETELEAEFCENVKVEPPKEKGPLPVSSSDTLPVSKRA